MSRCGDGRWGEAGAAAEEQAVIGAEPPVMEEVLRVEEHPPVGDRTVRLVCSQRLGGDDVAPDRDHSTPQPRNEPITVAIGGHQDIAGLDVAAWSADVKPATPPRLDAGRRRVLVAVGGALPSHP